MNLEITAVPSVVLQRGGACSLADLLAAKTCQQIRAASMNVHFSKLGIRLRSWSMRLAMQQHWLMISP